VFYLLESNGGISLVFGPVVHGKMPLVDALKHAIGMISRNGDDRQPVHKVIIPIPPVSWQNVQKICTRYTKFGKIDPDGQPGGSPHYVYKQAISFGQMSLNSHESLQILVYIFRMREV
jgi:hypothetical protein